MREMNEKDLGINNIDELIRKLSVENKVKATQKLTEYYAKARFRIEDEDFKQQYSDGPDDGGIDFYYIEDNTFFIFQTKFSESPKKVSTSEILDEIRKIKNTLVSMNPNRKAEGFINQLKRETANKNSCIEILWLTTNIVEDSVRKEVQDDLELWRKENGWEIYIDFIAIDRYSLESVIYDVKHGYIPYTGKKILKLEKGQWIETKWEETGVYSVVCIANVNDILRWFKSFDEIDKYLQKNVREFLGEKSKINKTMGKSYLEAAEWFWYKHNGIIIFADNVYIDKTKLELVLRNPQVVNGGQTLKSLFLVYDKNNRKDNSAKVILRVYQLPYEHTETYKRSIEIISALNSQNKINPSDLRSTDPRQVRLEYLFQKIPNGYKYIRKRSKDAKSTFYHILMRNLALRYYVCMKNSPHEGVGQRVEKLFEEDKKYNEIFDENAINRELDDKHIIIKYVTCWVIDRILQKLKLELPQIDRNYFQHTRWFVLVDNYRKLLEWKEKKFDLNWYKWIDFIESEHFRKEIFNYSYKTFRIAREIIPKREEPQSFFKNKEAVNKFNSKTSIREFESYMNKALSRFKKSKQYI
ncbi:MAG: AIPR family protein [Candidatus Anstonellaceae archaeon]